MIYSMQELINLKIRNYILNMNELIDNKIFLNSRPLSVQILLTNKCNLQCKICNFKNYHDGSIMSESVVKEILNNNPQLITVEWSGGGEPLMHPQFESFVDIAHSLCIKQILITNGLLLTKNIAEKIAKYNINLILSIDGPSKIIYEQLRINARYDILIKNIELLNMFRAKYNSKGFVRVYFIVIKDNYRYLLDMLKFLEQYNIKEIFFKSDATKSCDDIVSHGTIEMKNELSNILKQTMSYAKQKSINCMLDEGITQILFLNSKQNNMQIDKENKCLVPWQQIRILPKGEVVPTYFCSKEIGNVNDTSIDKLWNSEVMLEYRNKILNHISNTICNNFCIKKEAIARTHSGMERFLHTLMI